MAVSGVGAAARAVPMSRRSGRSARRASLLFAAVALLCARCASAADGFYAAGGYVTPEVEDYLENHTHEFFRGNSRRLLDHQERVLRFFGDSHVALQQGISEVVQLVTTTRQSMEIADRNLAFVLAEFQRRQGSLNSDGSEPATNVTQQAAEYEEMAHLVFTVAKARSSAKLAKEQHTEALANQPKWNSLISQLDSQWHAVMDEWCAISSQISGGGEGHACAGAGAHDKKPTAPKATRHPQAAVVPPPPSEGHGGASGAEL